MRLERYGYWHLWFAWRPVVINGDVVWLEWIERRRLKPLLADYRYPLRSRE